jgi:hypothetical protein
MLRLLLGWPWRPGSCCGAAAAVRLARLRRTCGKQRCQRRVRVCRQARAVLLLLLLAAAALGRQAVRHLLQRLQHKHT